MKLTITKEKLLPALAQVAGVVAKKATVPVMGNILLTAEDGKLTLTGGDMETSMTACVAVDVDDEGSITVPARKLLDITKAANKGADLKFSLAEKMTVKTGRSKFTLATLPAADYPSRDTPQGASLTMPADALSDMIGATAFAMAQNDVRYYLNGSLFTVIDCSLHVVATDGHRLATTRASVDADNMAATVPRDAVQALHRLIGGANGNVELTFSSNAMAATAGDYTLTTKLIDGKYPAWEKVIPQGNDNVVSVGADDLRGAMQRAAILSSDKFKGVRMTVTPGNIKLEATNPEQEQATEELECHYQGCEIEIGFNVAYMLEALAAIETEGCEIALKDASTAAVVTPDEGDARYVIMPMRI